MPVHSRPSLFPILPSRAQQKRLEQLPVFLCFSQTPGLSGQLLQSTGMYQCQSPASPDLVWSLGESALWLDMDCLEDENFWSELSAHPIGGLISVLDAGKLVAYGRDSVRHDAIALRRTIDAVSCMVNAPLRVYLIVSRFDALYGTASLVSCLHKQQRSRPLGRLYSGREEPARFGRRVVRETAEQLALSAGNMQAAAFQGLKEIRRLSSPLSFFCEHVFACNPYQRTGALQGLFFCASEERTGCEPPLIAKYKSYRAEKEPSMPQSWFVTELFNKVLPGEAHNHAVQPNRRGASVAVLLLGALLLILGLTNAFIEAKQVVEIALANTDSEAELLDQLEARNAQWYAPRFGMIEPLRLEYALAERHNQAAVFSEPARHQPRSMSVQQLADMVTATPDAHPLHVTHPAISIPASWTADGYALARAIIQDEQIENGEHLLQQYRAEALAQWRRLAGVVTAQTGKQNRAFLQLASQLDTPEFRFLRLAEKHLSAIFPANDPHPEIVWLRRLAALVNSDMLFKQTIRNMTHTANAGESALALCKGRQVDTSFAALIQYCEMLDQTCQSETIPVEWRGLTMRTFGETVQKTIASLAGEQLQAIWWETVYQPCQLLSPEQQLERMVEHGGLLEQFLTKPALGLWRMEHGRIVNYASQHTGVRFSAPFLQYCNWLLAQGRNKRPATIGMGISLKSFSVNPDALERPVGLTFTWQENDSSQSIQYRNYQIDGTLTWATTTTPKLVVRVDFPAFSLTREYRDDGLRHFLATLASGTVEWLAHDFPHQQSALVNARVGQLILRAETKNIDTVMLWLNFRQLPIPEYCIDPAGIENAPALAVPPLFKEEIPGEIRNHTIRTSLSLP